jgi:hypothetical protein
VFRRDRDAGDGGIDPAGGDRVHQPVPGAGLDGAGHAELTADGAGEIDIEAGQPSVRALEIVGREIVRRREADPGQGGRRGLVEAAVGIPEIGDRDRAGGTRGRRRAGALGLRRGGRDREQNGHGGGQRDASRKRDDCQMPPHACITFGLDDVTEASLGRAAEYKPFVELA